MGRNGALNDILSRVSELLGHIAAIGRRLIDFYVGLGLNTRETSVLIWAILFFGFMFCRREVRRSAGAVVHSFFAHAAIPIIAFSGAAYIAVLLVILRSLGIWATDFIKIAVLWFLGTGFSAIFYAKPVDRKYFSWLILRNLYFAAVIEFLVNVRTFPLGVELVLVPGLATLAGLDAVSGMSPEYAAVGRLVKGCIGTVGLIVLFFSLVQIVIAYREVLTISSVLEFALPVALAFWLVPFLYLVHYYGAVQSMLVMIRFGLADDVRLYRVARRAIILACSLSLGRVQFFERNFRFRLWGLTSEQAILDVVDEFRRSWRGRDVRVKREDSTAVEGSEF
jgi:hypothetical protein